MRACVFGAGAIGGHLAARLAIGGAELSVVCRGTQLEAVRERGLKVLTPDRTLHVYPAASDEAATLGVQDAVFVTVKAPALPSVAATIAPLLGPNTPVVFIGNGIPWWYFDSHGGVLDGIRLGRLDPGDIIRRAITRAPVIGGIVNGACAVVEPGVVSVAYSRNRVILGAPDGSLSGRLEVIAAPLRAGGIDVELTTRIRDAIWWKLAHNLTFNPACVLAQATPKEVYRNLACTAAARQSMVEVKEIAAALGCRADVDAEELFTRMLKSDHRPSILQDLDCGRPMEIDAVFDMPLQLARMVGVATPTLNLLVGLMKIRAAGAGLYRMQAEN